MRRARDQHFLDRGCAPRAAPWAKAAVIAASVEMDVVQKSIAKRCECGGVRARDESVFKSKTLEYQKFLVRSRSAAFAEGRDIPVVRGFLAQGAPGSTKLEFPQLGTGLKMVHCGQLFRPWRRFRQRRASPQQSLARPAKQ